MGISSPSSTIKTSSPEQQPTDIERALLELVASLGELDLLRPGDQDALLTRLGTIFDSQAAGVLLLHDDSADLHVYYSSGGFVSHLDDVGLDWGQGLIERAILSKATLSVPNAGKHPGLEKLLALLGRNDAALMAAPLFAGEQAYGALFVIDRLGLQFSARDQELLTTAARALAGHMRNQGTLHALQAANAGLEINRDQLLHSRNVLRALFDSFPDELYIIDRESRLTAVNIRRARRTGSHPNMLVGKICYQALYNRQSPCTDCRAFSTLATGEMAARTRREWSPDSETQEWEIYSYPIYDGSDQVVQAILLEQDITEKRHLELTLAQSEKLAAMGQWAASLAHELNNPLTAIIANAQLLGREIPFNDDRHELVDLIARAGERANQVVRNLLDLARKDEYLFKPTDVNQTLRKSLDFLQHELVARSINLVFEPAESLPLVQASSDHLQGIWLNLLTNALDSIEDEPGTIQIKSFEQDNQVFVLILDNGKGIAADKLERIFEPFFTTKTPGRGTGLGLSVCQRIIKQHGGRIQVESQPGAGTQFTVILPVF